jgi:hypothetical protein
MSPVAALIWLKVDGPQLRKDFHYGVKGEVTCSVV